MTALPPELWLIILECLVLADLRIAGQVCQAWHTWAFNIRWRSHPVPLKDIISLLEPQRLRKVYRYAVVGSCKHFEDILARFFNIVAKITTIVFDPVMDADVIPLLKGLVESSPSKALFPALRSLEYAVGAAYSDINEIITGSKLKKITITSTPYDESNGVLQIFYPSQHHQDLEEIDVAGDSITSMLYDEIDGVPQSFLAFQHHQDLEDIDLAGGSITSTPDDGVGGVPQILRAFQHHQDLEEIALAGGSAFNFSQIHSVPWPPRLRRLHFNGVWTFRSWKELVERCVELHHAKFGYYSLEPSAPENAQPTITAPNLGVLDLDDASHSHRTLLILRKTEMPELRELSFKLREDAMQEGTEDEVEEALRVLGEKSPKLGRLRVETWIPLETELLSKFRGLETLHISNQAGEAWPWVYWDEDIEIIARSMPHLAHLRLLGLTYCEPGATMVALDSLAIHCKQLHTLAIGINATEFHFPDDVGTPFTKTFTSMTFSPLRLPTSAAALLARNLAARMPGVDKFQGSVMGLDEGGIAFYWGDGLKIIEDSVERFRNGGVAEIW